MYRLMTPTMSRAEYRAISRVLRTGFLTQGPISNQFEIALSEKNETKYAFVTSSATTALSLSLSALGVGAGDEVIIADFSFPATANAVIAVGATPIPCDIRLDDYGIDSTKVERLISKRTKVIIPVHCFGLPCDMSSLMEIANSNGICVLEDAACAIGAKYQDKNAGTFGIAGVFSFHPRKLITTGEGGAIVCNDEDIASKIRTLRTHGSRQLKTYLEFIEPGFNFRMSDINAAIGIEQLKKLENIISTRRSLVEIYNSEFNDFNQIIVPKEHVNRTHTYQSYVIRVDEINVEKRDDLIQGLRMEGIEATLGTYAISSQPYFKSRLEKRKHTSRWNSKLAQDTTITLPLHSQLKPRDISKISSVLKKLLRSPGR